MYKIKIKQYEISFDDHFRKVTKMVDKKGDGV